MRVTVRRRRSRRSSTILNSCGMRSSMVDIGFLPYLRSALTGILRIEETKVQKEVSRMEDWGTRK